MASQHMANWLIWRIDYGELAYSFGFDSSKTKIGRQITRNWCGSVLEQIKVAWSNSQLSNDRIRMLLKSTFYPLNFIAFNF